MATVRVAILCRLENHEAMTNLKQTLRRSFNVCHVLSLASRPFLQGAVNAGLF